MYDIKEIGMVPPPYGGVSIYISRLIERLSIDGFSVGGYYISKSDSNANTDWSLFDQWTWLETVFFPVKIFRLLFQLRNYRIIHSHLGMEAMVYLWTVKKVLRKKLIITIHNSMVNDYYQSSNFINKFFLRLMAADPNVYWIAVSEEGKNQMESLPIEFVSVIHVIPAYIPTPVSDSPICVSMDDYLRKHEKNLLFYGHSFMNYKNKDIYGFKDMLEIYNEVKRSCNSLGLVYCIADVSDEESIEELFAFARRLGVHDNIYWQLGGLKGMASLWERIDVYVRPTNTDGDSVSIREALEAGVQVVASNVCKRPEKCFIYLSGDMTDASKAVLRALSIGRNPTSNDFSYYEKMRSIYKSMLES